MGNSKIGRKTKWKPEFTDLVYQEAKKNLFITHSDLAKVLNVNATTVGEWMKSKPELKEAIKKGKNDFWD